VALGLARERKGENERMGGRATMGRGTGERERGCTGAVVEAFCVVGAHE